MRIRFTSLLAVACVFTSVLAAEGGGSGFYLAKPPSITLRAGADLGGKSVQSAEMALYLPFSGKSRGAEHSGARFGFGLEGSLGGLFRHDRGSLLISLGPAVTVNSKRNSGFLRIASAPTFLSHPKLGDFDLGGSLHFTSSLTVGRMIAERTLVAYRFQHISNGGIKMQNPGVDLHCIGIVRMF